MIKDNTKSPAKTIHQYCIIDCLNNHQIDMCSSPNCELYQLRFGKKVKGLYFLRQIKKYCIDCSEGVKNIKKCNFINCSLFKYRFGKNPDRMGSRPDMIARGRLIGKSNGIANKFDDENQK